MGIRMYLYWVCFGPPLMETPSKLGCQGFQNSGAPNVDPKKQGSYYEDTKTEHFKTQTRVRFHALGDPCDEDSWCYMGVYERPHNL